MPGFRYSYVISGRSAEELSGPVRRLAELDYDAVELGAELPLAEAGRARDLIEDAGLSVSSICPSFTTERDLAHPEPEVRENALRYLRDVADLAATVGAPVIIAAPTAFLRTRPIASESEEWDLAVESIGAAGEYAASVGVDLTLECWNLDVGYPGYLTFELDPRASVRSGVVPAEGREDPTSVLMQKGIEHLRHLESRLGAT